jgi:RNase adapter protein RapZ
VSSDPSPSVDVTVISGMSGAGRSEAANALEDLGWFVIDNLPPALIDTMLSLALGPGKQLKRVALVIDARGGSFFGEATKALQRLRRSVGNFRLIFLDASDDVLVRRFDSSRRRHPLATDDPVVVGIQRERELMRPLREGADLIIDTSEISVRQLRRKISASFEGDDGIPTTGLRTTLVSFGYKFGLPLDADTVLDVRFLANPYWIDGLRELTGLQEPVKDYVLGQKETGPFLDRIRELFATILPGYQAEGRHYLTIAVGCTGGRHRSVVLSEEIARFIRDEGFSAKVIHRDVERPPVSP